MSHGIMENDTVMHVGSAWHNLGISIKEAVSSVDALRIANLDWQVASEKVIIRNKETEYFANVRSDTNETLGIVTGKYSILQNNEAFGFVDDIMQNSETKYESAGSLFNGRRVWMLAKMPEENILDDIISPYLFFTNSHDGKSSIRVGLTPVRVVCNNTLQLAINTSQRTWKTVHKGSIEGKRVEAMETLGFASKYIDSFKLRAEQLVSVHMNIDDFLDKMFPLKDNASNCITRNIESVREKVRIIHNTKPDLANFQNTGWVIYNAIADHFSNSEPLKRTDTFETKRFVSMLDGSDMLEKAELIISA